MVIGDYVRVTRLSYPQTPPWFLGLVGRVLFIYGDGHASVDLGSCVTYYFSVADLELAPMHKYHLIAKEICGEI